MGNLKGKFIHLTGSVPADSPGHDVALVKRFVAGLAEGVLRNGGGLVVLVNKRVSKNGEGGPVCAG